MLKSNKTSSNHIIPVHIQVLSCVLGLWLQREPWRPLVRSDKPSPPTSTVSPMLTRKAETKKDRKYYSQTNASDPQFPHTASEPQKGQDTLCCSTILKHPRSTIPLAFKNASAYICLIPKLQHNFPALWFINHVCGMKSVGLWAIHLKHFWTIYSSSLLKWPCDHRPYIDGGVAVTSPIGLYTVTLSCLQQIWQRNVLSCRKHPVWLRDRNLSIKL